MKISEYTKEYTAGEPITFRDMITEVGELVMEVFNMKWDGMKEEFEDVFHFLQLWLYSRFGVDGELWGITKNSVRKFMDRKQVWNRMYVLVGLPENISGYVGNYKKIEKVSHHLQKLGVAKKRAEEAYRKVVLGNS